MQSVPIAELKNRLSMYLQRVRAGEEIVIRDRNLPVAKLVPLSAHDVSAEELSLVAAGLMKAPSQRLDEKLFWSLGGPRRGRRKLKWAVREVVSRNREDREHGLLGR